MNVSENRHEDAPWYHGTITRERAQSLMLKDSLVVRDICPPNSYEVLTAVTAPSTFEILRRRTDGLLKIKGLPLKFTTLFAAVMHLTELLKVHTFRRQASV